MMTPEDREIIKDFDADFKYDGISTARLVFLAVLHPIF
jgi:hypothetical protein